MSKLEINEDNKIVYALAKKLKVQVKEIEKIEFYSEDYDGVICMNLDVYLKGNGSYTRFVADWDKVDFKSDKLPKNIIMQ